MAIVSNFVGVTGAAVNAIKNVGQTVRDIKQDLRPDAELSWTTDDPAQIEAFIHRKFGRRAQWGITHGTEGRTYYVLKNGLEVWTHTPQPYRSKEQVLREHYDLYGT